MSRPFRIDLTDYTCLQKYMSSRPELRTEFEDLVLDLRKREITTVVIDDADGSEVYDLFPLD